MIARAIVAAALLASCASATAGEIRSYETGHYRDAVAPLAGRRTVVHVWGMSCAPCMTELPRWGRFVSGRRRGRGRGDVVFVETDEASPAALGRIVDDARIGSAPQWRLASPFDERARFEIDPTWQGELPITLMIDRDGTVERVSGPVDFAVVRRFLDR